MATAKLRMLPCLFLMLSGCAIVSQRSFTTQLERNLSDTSLAYSTNIYSVDLLQSLTLTGSVDIPLLIHYERSRPPYVIGWRVVDEGDAYERLEIDCVTVQYDEESPETFVPQLNRSDLEFNGHGRLRDINLRFYDHKLKRHEPVTITVTGTAIQRDGTRAEFCSTESFFPQSQDYVMDWYSWCAGI